MLKKMLECNSQRYFNQFFGKKSSIAMTGAFNPREAKLDEEAERELSIHQLL